MSDQAPQSSPRGPAYRIQTARLVLRCWELSDAPRLKEAVDASITHLTPWMPWVKDEPQPLHTKVKLLREFRGKFDLDQDYFYAVFDAAETRLLGGAGLHTRRGQECREIGYWIRPEDTRQGYATELTAALVRVAFEISDVRWVEIRVDPKNEPSLRIPRKLGFSNEGTLRARMRDATDQPIDTVLWSMLPHEYPQSPAARVPVEAFDAADAPIPLRPS